MKRIKYGKNRKFQAAAIAFVLAFSLCASPLFGSAAYAEEPETKGEQTEETKVQEEEVSEAPTEEVTEDAAEDVAENVIG